MRLNGWKTRAMIDRYTETFQTSAPCRPSASVATCTDWPGSEDDDYRIRDRWHRPSARSA